VRDRFNDQLYQLNKEIIEMGTMCEEAIELVVKSLRAQDKVLAQTVKKNGVEIDRMESDIEARCMKLLLHQQPVARDLRQISAALKMITDMERIGDQAEDIADIIICMANRNIEKFDLISEMAQSTINMVSSSVSAYVKNDIQMAQSVIDYDDTVDDYFNKIKSDIIKYISETSSNGEVALDLLMIAKYFERIGDHATNIAEWVIYSVTGVHKDVLL